MELKEMSVEQLKALGFDLVNQISQAQQNLAVIQQELQARAQAPEPERGGGEEA